LIWFKQSPDRAKSNKIQIKLSKLGPCLVELVWAKVRMSHQSDQLARTQVGLIQHRPKSNWVGPDWPRFVSSQINVSPCYASRVGPLSSWDGPNLGGIKLAKVHVKLNRLGQRSNRVNLGPHRVGSKHVKVKLGQV